MYSGGLGKGLEVSWNLSRRKPVEPMFVHRGLELPLLQHHIENEFRSTIDQRGHDRRQGNHLGPAKTSNPWFPQDGIVVLWEGPKSGIRLQPESELKGPFRLAHSQKKCQKEFLNHLISANRSVMAGWSS